MQLIKLDSENSLFDATNKSYASLDYLVKLLNDNGGNITNLPSECIYDETISVSNNYTIYQQSNNNNSITYNVTDNQNTFDIVANVCIDLDNLANIISDNNISLGNNGKSITINKKYISDIKLSNTFNLNKLRFNTGYQLTNGSIGTINFLLKEDGSYLLQENLDKIII